MGRRRVEGVSVDLTSPLRGNLFGEAFAAFERTYDQAGENFLQARARYIDDCYANGGKGFLERTLRYGTDYRGNPVSEFMLNWQKEHLELIGDYRVVTVHTQGPAQLGKSMNHYLLLCDSVASGRLNAAWLYDSVSNMEANQPTQFRPTIENWLTRMEALDRITYNRDRDTQTIKIYQIEQANCIFRGAHNATSTSKAKAGMASVQSGLASFQADFVILEERSQWAPGEADAVPRRIDASALRPGVIRSVGTPGAGNGIEAEIAKCQWHFYPHYTCRVCKKTLPLDPKGCLLKPQLVMNVHGKKEERYLTESGRPLDWWYLSETNPQGSAYFACSNCGKSLEDGLRKRAHFRCLKTGISLREFLDALPSTPPQERLEVGIQFSPLCRITTHNLAQQIITDGFRVEDAAEWQQQSLGHASHKPQGQLTAEILKAAIQRPRPTRLPECRLAGIDQGRGSYWIWIADFIPPAGYAKMPLEQVIESTHRICVYAGEIAKGDIPACVFDRKVEFGLIDNEPERTVASETQRTTVLRMADQKPGQVDATKEIMVVDGGEEYPCWGLRNDKFLTQVLNSFLSLDSEGFPLQALPHDWERWLVIDAEASPVRQLLSPLFDRKREKWVRPDGNDDIFYACMFAEAAYYLWLQGYGSNSFNRSALATLRSQPMRSTSISSIGRRFISNGRRRR
jgi:hypothetical protein